jgi:hypothetical protein
MIPVDLRLITRPGDILGTEGHVRFPADFWPPWDIPGSYGKGRVYHYIRAYQRWRGHTYWRLTHIRLVTAPGQFFEWTTPRARFGDFSELAGKKVSIFRPQLHLDMGAVLATCQLHAGEGYDYRELVRFAAARWDGFELLRRILGRDRADRYVCSTGAAMALAAGGYTFPWDWQGWCPSTYGQPGSTFAPQIIARAA